MTEHDIAIGDRSFTFFELKPFDAVKHGMKLKNVLTAGFSDLNANVAQMLSGLNENTLEEIIFPILRDSMVVCTSASKKVDGPKALNEIYTVADLDEFFELVGHVLAVNFGPLVKKTLSRFGVDLDRLDLAKVRALVQEKMQSAQA